MNRQQLEQYTDSQLKIMAISKLTENLFPSPLKFARLLLSREWCIKYLLSDNPQPPRS